MNPAEQSRIQGELDFINTAFSKVEKMIDKLVQSFDGFASRLSPLLTGGINPRDRGLITDPRFLSGLNQSPSVFNQSNTIQFNGAINANNPNDVRSLGAKLEARLIRLGKVNIVANRLNPDRPFR